MGQEVLGLDNVSIPRTHKGSVTSCSPAVERNTHIENTPRRESQAPRHTQLKCKGVPRTLFGPLSSLCPCSCPPHHPQHTHLPLYLLSAIRTSDDNTGRKCCHGNTIRHILLPTPTFNPVVGPQQEQLLRIHKAPPLGNWWN